MKKYIPVILAAYAVVGTITSSILFGADGVFIFLIANILGAASYFFGEQFK